ncbi:helix-turn-helix domain-containing protein [Paracoccus mutanolyticus]|uniref:helix-turn-helix domain-containing protein n=1 Tax=Paracoccus mutanolyticus TaxID=1499308 RepID=UPI001CB8D5F4|nr:helix-turn-helix transcriptional regulator [Paracoccus mutanolyticus]
MARVATGLGIRELAALADVSPNTISRLERGEDLRPGTIRHRLSRSSGAWPEMEQDLAAVGIRLNTTLRSDWVGYCNEWRQGAASGLSATSLSAR